MSCPTCPARSLFRSFGLNADSSTCTTDNCRGGDTPPCQQSEDDSWVGEVLDRRYVLCRRLHDGERGHIYEAQSLSSPKRFAIKIIDEAVDTYHWGTVRSRNPHLVQIIDILRLESGETALVLPLITGVPLSVYIRDEGPLESDQALKLGHQLASALLSLHLEDHLHGDVHPANVLIETLPSGELFAHLLNASWGRTMGTGPMKCDADPLLYTPPEELLGQSPDEEADIYSLGAVLHFMLTGTSPFAPGQREVVTQTILNGMALPKSPQDSLTWWLATLMARDGRHRPKSMRQVISRLSELRQSLDCNRLSGPPLARGLDLRTAAR